MVVEVDIICVVDNDGKDELFIELDAMFIVEVN